MSDWTEGDEIKCSKCGHTWRDNCAFEYQVGTEVECPECRTALGCIDIELTRRWTWGAVRETPPQPADTDTVVADADEKENDDG